MTSETVETPFKYTLVGPGVAVERELSQTAAFATLQIALGAVPTPATAVAGSNRGSMAGSSERKLSLREFMQEASAKTYPSKIVVTGRYLRDVEGQPDFSRDEIKDRFRTAGEPPASNLPRDFTVAVGAGWIAEDHDSRGRYYVTRKGDEAAERSFEGGAPSVKSRKRRKLGSGEPSDDAGLTSDGEA